MDAPTRDLRLWFVTALTCWSVVLLGILRSPVGTQMLVEPFVAWQAAFAGGVGGSPVVVDLSCSGTDVIALSIAALLAYPLRWQRRLTGVALAIVWLGSLNLLRVVTLVQTAGTPLFMPLHIFIWPALLIAGSAAFVFGWIWTTERAALATDRDYTRKRNLITVTALLAASYIALTPWLLSSDVLQRGAMTLATVAAALLRALNLNALVGGSTLVIGQHAFLVTPECVVTPLMPIYLAWAASWPDRLLIRGVALALFAPLFALLGLLRLMTIALPALIGPPLFLTHGFYQFVVALLLIGTAARWRASQTCRGTTFGYFACGLAAATIVTVVLVKPYTSAVEAASYLFPRHVPLALSPTSSSPDIQGAMSILPGFQLALLCALSVVMLGRRAWAVLLVLVPAGAVLQIATLVIAREIGDGVTRALPITALRAASLVTPLALVLTAALYIRTRAQRVTLLKSRA